MIIEKRINNFKKDLFSNTLDEHQILRKHIIEVDTYLFLNNPNKECVIKSKIADSFGVDKNKIIIVGSAKIGYSISPIKLFKHIDDKFYSSNKKKDKSDIDVAIISEKLFFDLQKRFYMFSDSLQLSWKKNEYYKGSKNNNRDDLDHSFYKYNYKGWFRLDFKPPGFEVCTHETFEELKRYIQQETGRKIGLAIYQNNYFFEIYHCENIRKLKLKIESEKI